MDYRDKYIKYKTKYIKLMKQLGGVIEASFDNSYVEMIDTQDKLDEIKDELLERYKICEPMDALNIDEIKFMNDGSIYWVLKDLEYDQIIGSIQTSDLEPYENSSKFELIGGITGAKGLFITGVCNSMPDKFKNVATILLKAIDEYAWDRYDYLLLHADISRDYLHSEGERKGLYIKNGFLKIGILRAGILHDTDSWIMRKDL